MMMMMVMMTMTTTWRTSVRKPLFLTHRAQMPVTVSVNMEVGCLGLVFFGLPQTAPSSTGQGLLCLQARWAAITMLS